MTDPDSPSVTNTSASSICRQRSQPRNTFPAKVAAVLVHNRINSLRIPPPSCPHHFSLSILPSFKANTNLYLLLEIVSQTQRYSSYTFTIFLTLHLTTASLTPPPLRLFATIRLFLPILSPPRGVRKYFQDKSRYGKVDGFFEQRRWSGTRWSHEAYPVVGRRRTAVCQPWVCVGGGR